MALFWQTEAYRHGHWKFVNDRHEKVVHVVFVVAVLKPPKIVVVMPTIPNHVQNHVLILDEVVAEVQ